MSPISAFCATSRRNYHAGSADAARNHDLVLTSGGVSTGEADHVRDVVEKLGKLVFWRIAIKPGRPVAMGVSAWRRRKQRRIRWIAGKSGGSRS